MELRETYFSLIIAFLVIDTLTVGLRVVVRTRITKSFKYDDVGMLVAYVRGPRKLKQITHCD
jgi:hypothetical protein